MGDGWLRILGAGDRQFGAIGFLVLERRFVHLWKSIMGGRGTMDGRPAIDGGYTGKSGGCRGIDGRGGSRPHWRDWRKGGRGPTAFLVVHIAI